MLENIGDGLSHQDAVTVFRGPGPTQQLDA